MSREHATWVTVSVVLILGSIRIRENLSIYFLAKEKLLSPYQCGFCKGHSTELAVLSFTDSIRHSMDQGLLTGTVFFFRYAESI